MTIHKKNQIVKVDIMRRKVIGVIDGDTIRVARKIDGTNKIRLAGFNAPELHQSGGQEAKRILSRLVNGKEVTIHPKGRSYDRIVADIIINRKSAARKLREIS